jgi:PHD/YefM family antitoxin component YafN of YafNO toxin-antitoxin module
MPVTTITSTEFRRSTFRGLSVAAKRGPVHITTRSRTTHVLISFEEYCRLTGNDPETLASQIDQGFSPGTLARKERRP